MSQNYKFSDKFSTKGPREKLIDNGPDALSNAELLAIIFVTGTRDENVLELSNRVIKDYGSRSIINIKDVGKAIELIGLGRSKACQLVATFELGRRYYLEQSSRMPTIRGPEEVFKIMSHMSKLKKEELRAIYINSRQKIIREELISLGNENMNIVSPKEILQPAVELMAKGIIIVHNHPSGEVEPSDSDIKFTEKMAVAAEILGIGLVDHLIIGNENYYSFSENGLI